MIELLCALARVLPGLLKLAPIVTPVAALILALEGIFLAVVDARYDTRFSMNNPMVYALIQVVEAAILAYGRFFLRPL